MASTVPDLSEILEALDPAAPLAQRHLWLISLLNWLRHDTQDPDLVQARVRLLLDAAQARPEWRAQWYQWWQIFMDTMDTTPLLADHGFAPRTAFLSELGQRLSRKMLPSTPETTDLAELFDLLLPSVFDARWLRALDHATLERASQLLFTPPPALESLEHDGVRAAESAPEVPAPSRPRLNVGQLALLDALTCSISQISATGFASEIRTRMALTAQEQRPFHNLPAYFERLRSLIEHTGVRSPSSLEAAEALRQHLDACRHAAYTVYTHLEQHGISVGIVFRLRQLRERVLRAKALLDCLQSEFPPQQTVILLAHLVQVSDERRSIRSLIASSSQLTAAKVAERSAESGEHYITRDAAEYQAMLGKAAGGGMVIGWTTLCKFLIYNLGLNPFWTGVASGMNYALSFVLIMLLHWTVATKQPAVTAPAMAAKLKEVQSGASVEEFVDEVAHLFRSQIAAILGNIGLVIPTVLLIFSVLDLSNIDVLDAEHAQHVLHDNSLLGLTALFAAFTGVLLFGSSIIAGWFENWFVLHRLDSAIQYNPRITRWLGGQRAQRWAIWLRNNISGLAANISLGLLLGLVPAFLGFFGVGLEVRHVTLSTGQVAAAAYVLGASVLQQSDFWWAVAGLLVIGPLNLGVSFYLALRVAMRANNISGIDRVNIQKALRQRCLRSPGSFFLPR